MTYREEQYQRAAETRRAMELQHRAYQTHIDNGAHDEDLPDFSCYTCYEFDMGAEELELESYHYQDALERIERLESLTRFLNRSPTAYAATYCAVCGGEINEDTTYCELECEHPTRGFWYLVRRARQYAKRLEVIASRAKATGKLVFP